MAIKRPSLWLAVPLLAALGLGGYWYWQSRPLAVTVARAHRGEAVELVYATGFVEPEQPVAVASRVTAPIAEVLVDEGDSVRRGQALLRLDDSDLRSAVAQAQAQSVNATLAERRAVALYARGWVTRAARDAAVASGAAARAATEAAAAKLGQNVLRAGIDGIVIKRDIQPGELATPTRILMSLGDPSHVRVTATVDERDIPRVRVGQNALLSSDAWPGRILHGHVRELTPTGDPNERAFRARLAIDEAARLPMGMTLEVNIVSRRVHDALLVPTSALADGRIWQVRDGRAHALAVRGGIVGTEQAQIVSGLADGATVIDRPPADLREGDRVRPADR